MKRTIYIPFADGKQLAGWHYDSREEAEKSIGFFGRTPKFEGLTHAPCEACGHVKVEPKADNPWSRAIAVEATLEHD